MSGLFSKLNSLLSGKKTGIEYFEVPRPSGDGLCSDKSCPCPETVIPRGSGYLYISQELINFRKDCLTYAQLQRKLDAMAKVDSLNDSSPDGFIRFLPAGTSSPIMMCKQGAILRDLDLNVAASDAAYWWKTGLVPLRVTPKAGSSGNNANCQEPITSKKIDGKKVCAMCDVAIPDGAIECPACNCSHFKYVSEAKETPAPQAQPKEAVPQKKLPKVSFLYNLQSYSEKQGHPVKMYVFRKEPLSGQITAGDLVTAIMVEMHIQFKITMPDDVNYYMCGPLEVIEDPTDKNAFFGGPTHAAYFTLLKSAGNLLNGVEKGTHDLLWIAFEDDQGSRGMVYIFTKI